MIRSAKKTLFFFFSFSILFSPVYELHAQFFSPFEIDGLIGKQAPSFTAQDLSGDEVSFSSYKGNPILLNFWATWCPYCREERPQLNALYKEYRGQGLEIVSVSLDRSPEKVRKYLRKMPAGFTVLHDSKKEATDSYGVYSLPTSFLIDRKGIIKQKVIGPNWTGMKKKFIEELIK
jgi:DsbE subfamily thiol:disulfide oxidoreductase